MNLNFRLFGKVLSKLSCQCPSCFTSRYMATNSTDTFFGFQQMAPEEKAREVKGVFERVAGRYDVMNDLMSVGIHRLWKDYFISTLVPKPHTKILDVAGGTGDIAFRIVNYVASQSRQFSGTVAEAQTDAKDSVKVIVCDITQGMLEVGLKRAKKLGHDSIEWVCGDAQALPFDNDTFDAYTIAFGMRNVVDIDKALREAFRVLKPGGRFLCLEFSKVQSAPLQWLYDSYSFQLIPVMGEVIAGDWKSYQYLVESIRQFPDQEKYERMIKSAGFRNTTSENLTFGITAIHSGFKL